MSVCRIATTPRTGMTITPNYALALNTEVGIVHRLLATTYHLESCIGHRCLPKDGPQDLHHGYNLHGWVMNQPQLIYVKRKERQDWLRQFISYHYYVARRPLCELGDVLTSFFITSLAKYIRRHRPSITPLSFSQPRRMLHLGRPRCTHFSPSFLRCRTSPLGPWPVGSWYFCELLLGVTDPCYGRLLVTPVHTTGVIVLSRCLRI